MHRRTFLATGLAALATVRSDLALSCAQLQVAERHAAPAGESATAALVRKRAQELSLRAFEPPRETLAPSLAGMGYDEYRDLRFRPERALWRGEALGFRTPVLSVGIHLSDSRRDLSRRERLHPAAQR